jgi:hypothetical protein
MVMSIPFIVAVNALSIRNGSAGVSSLEVHAVENCVHNDQTDLERCATQVRRKSRKSKWNDPNEELEVFM